MLARTTAVLTGLPVVCVWLLAAAASPQHPPDALTAFLRYQMQLSPADFAALRQGQVVASLPKALDKREVAAFGIVRVTAPSAAFAAALLDVETYMRGDAVLQIGRFSDPPSLDDVRTLTLQAQDLEGLRHCRVGDCGLKLSAAMIERFRNEVHWSAPDWRDQATLLFRRILVDYVTTSLAVGSSALAEYVDTVPVVKLADETRALVGEPPYLRDTASEFLTRLGRTPPAPLPELKQVIYWSKEQFGFKPTITVTHLTIYELGDGRARTTFVVSKQLYATHYFEASVAFTVARRIRNSLEASLLEKKTQLERQAAYVVP